MVSTSARGEIKSVLKSSPLWSEKVRPGDFLLRINGQGITDLIDYQYAIADEELTMEFSKPNGREFTAELVLEPGEDPGLEFTTPVFDGIQSCHNHCVFCFVDQMPPGMRRSLYVKDDDYRLSFLYGNFITLTHVAEEAMERIKTLHLSPLYISVHTTNPGLRKKMVRCARNENILKQIDELLSFGIYLHTQVVVLPEINDGDELEQTIRDLAGYWPQVMSIGVVPVGLTRFSRQDSMFPFRAFEPRDARSIRHRVEGLQKEFQKRYGEPLVNLADEFYFHTGSDFPPDEHYGDYPQLENGIGMVRRLYTEIRSLRGRIPKELNRQKKFTVVTGALVSPVIRSICEDLCRKIKGLEIEILDVKNRWFGETVTVTGLLTGADVQQALMEKYKRETEHRVILLPDVMLNEGRFLDDLTPESIATESGLSIMPFDTCFEGFLDAIERG